MSDEHELDWNEALAKRRRARHKRHGRDWNARNLAISLGAYIDLL